MGAFYAWLSSFPAWVFYGVGAAVVVEAVVLCVWSRWRCAAAQPGGRNIRPVSWRYCVVLVVVGVVLVGFPPVAQWANVVYQRRVVDGVLDGLVVSSRVERDARIEEAQRYNRGLDSREYAQIGDAAGGVGVSVGEEYERYVGLLNEGGSSFIGMLRIPVIGVDLPIFHGTSSDVLKKGVGHVFHTALPVGGVGTHSALSAHAGLAGWRFFSDVGKLEVGDEWSVDVYGREFRYRVVEKRVVLPDQVEVLAPREGEDLMSLVTCTPVGVNSHRIIVTGRRVN